MSTQLWKLVQQAVGTTPDGIPGPRTAQAVLKALGKNGLAGGDGWAFTAEIDGDDIVVRNVRATCFGGDSDPEDSGETASGVRTKGNPGLLGCALPRRYIGGNAALRAALGDSPIPSSIPFFTKVRVTANGKTIEVPFIDLGPAKRTGNAIDLTVAAATLLDNRASATSFEATVDYRILGTAKYA